MTKLGKYLVIANLVLSVCFLGIAAGVATNRIDWPGAGKAGEAKAGVALKADEIKEWQQAASLAYARYSAAFPDLLQVEQERPAKQDWYANQLSILQTGKDKAGKAFAGQIGNLVYQNGQVQLDPKTGMPVLQPMPAVPVQLKPIPAMVEDLAAVQGDLKKEMDKVAKHMQEEERLTKEVNGDPKAKTKGLRDLLAEEVGVEKNLQGELEYLRPLRYNRQVEAALLMKRQLSLKGRLEELKNVGVAAR